VTALVLVALMVGACSGGDGGDLPVWATSAPATTQGGVSTVTSTSGDGDGADTTVPSDQPVEVGVIGIAATDVAAVVEIEGGLLQTDRIVVVLEPGTSVSRADEIAGTLGGAVIGTLGYLDLYQISIPGGGDEASVRAIVEEAKGLADVQLAYADELVFFFAEYVGVRTSPLNDPVYQDPKSGGGYRAIGVDLAWQYIRGSGIEPWSVTVGVTDTKLWRGAGEFDEANVTVTNPGSETPQPETGSYHAHGWSGQWSQPDGGHGTAVTSIIAADANDGGVAGVASVLGDRLNVIHTDVMDVPQLTPAAPNPDDLTQYTHSSGSTWSVRGLEGLLTQVKAGAKVINMSWGAHNANNPELGAAFRRFFTQMATDHPDVVFVAAAGNNSDPSPDGTRSFPGGLRLDNVVTVGNVNNDGTTYESSNLSSDSFEVTLAAPGHEAVRGVDANGNVIDNTTVRGTVTRTRADGTQETSDSRSGGGTSMAAPQVTATIALMKALDPTLTAAQIKEILRDTARRALPASDPAGSAQPISPALGAGLLATDEAVLAVINKVRADNGQGPLTGEQLVAFAVIDAVAVGDPDDFVVRATVAGCRDDCTDVTIRVSGEHALTGSTTQSLSSPGQVEWDLVIGGDYPVTILVQRTDNGAGSLITISPLLLDGHYVGTAENDGHESCEGLEILGFIFGLELELTTSPGGTGDVVFTLSWGSESGVSNALLTWDGATVGWETDDFVFSGTVVPDREPLTLAGPWNTYATWEDVTDRCPLYGTWEATRTE